MVLDSVAPALLPVLFGGRAALQGREKVLLKLRCAEVAHSRRQGRPEALV